MLTLFHIWTIKLLFVTYLVLFGSQPQRRCTNNVHAQFTSFWQAYIIDSYCFGLSTTMMMMMMTKCGYLTSIEYRRKYQTLLSLIPILLLLLLLVSEVKRKQKKFYICVLVEMIIIQNLIAAVVCFLPSVDHILLFNLRCLEG